MHWLKTLSNNPPSLIDELRHLNDAKRAIICEFQSCSPSGFGFGLGSGLGSGLLEGGFSTLSCSFVLFVNI